MSQVTVQCKGSGKSSGASFNSKKIHCLICGKLTTINSNGNLKKHMRIVTKSRLKKL